MQTLQIIPGGTFFSLEPNQFVAMKYVHRWGEWLAEHHPELAEMYRDTTKPFSARVLCRDFLSEDMVPNDGVAMTAITYAISLLMTRVERDKITSIRRSQLLEAMIDFESPEWREHCRRAAIVRHSKGRGVDVKAMLDARGRTAWTTEEKDFLWQLSRDEKFRTGCNGGADYVKIATEINNRFHEGKEIRYENSCRSMVADLIRKGIKTPE